MISTLYYGIIDRRTNYPWSRNGWGQIGSCPDLYQTKAAAERQIAKGKIASLRRYWESDPVVVTWKLELVDYLGITQEEIS